MIKKKKKQTTKRGKSGEKKLMKAKTTASIVRTFQHNAHAAGHQDSNTVILQMLLRL